MNTRERILEAAESLFAQHGFAGASLRSITARAGVNLAAVNYYFRSKEALLEAVFERRLGPVNQKRLELLEACEAGAAQPSLECLLEALVAPPFRMSAGPQGMGAALPRLLGRVYLEPGEAARKILRRQLEQLATRFIAAFRRVLPELPEVELLWRLHFTVGIMAHTLAGFEPLHVLSGGRCDLSDVEAIIRRIVEFAAAGLRAAPDTAEPGPLAQESR